MKIGTDVYLAYLHEAYERIHASEVYVTDLDLATGDGDHWVNLNKGFTALESKRPQLKSLPLDKLFLQIGMTLMSTVGGSSGVLYGGAYIAGSKALEGQTEMDIEGLYKVLDVMCQDICQRGKVQAGWKTMVDAFLPAVEALRGALDAGKSEQEALAAMAAAAKAGALATKEMQAIRGRANYQANKGVGHLDPGAVTLSYQLEALADVLTERLSGGQDA